MPKIAYTDEIENCGVSFIYDTAAAPAAFQVFSRLSKWLKSQHPDLLDENTEIQEEEEAWRDPTSAIYAVPPVEVPATKPVVTPPVETKVTKQRRTRRTKAQMLADGDRKSRTPEQVETEKQRLMAGAEPEAPADLNPPALALIDGIGEIEAPETEDLVEEVLAGLDDGRMNERGLTDFLYAISPTMEVRKLVPVDRKRLYDKLMESQADAG